MALSAYLIFPLDSNENTKYLLTNFKCHTQRHHNGARPDADPMCERIELSIIVPKNDQVFYKWYIEGNSLDGAIMMETSNSKYFKKYEFNGAVCFAFSVNYNANENEQMILTLSLMAKETKIDNDDKTDMSKKTTDYTMTKEIILKADSEIREFPLQYFHYNFNRDRNSSGFPIGPTREAVLEFAIKCEYSNNEYFMSMLEQDKFSFYIDDTLKYTVNGYIVGTEIEFDRDPNEKIYELTNKMNEIIDVLNSKVKSNVKTINVEDLPQYSSNYTSMRMRVRVLITDMNIGKEEKLKLVVTE